MKIRKSIRVLAVCLISGLGLSSVQPVKGQTFTWTNANPLFQFAMLYSGLMEFTDCSPTVINGRVHGNSNIYVGSPSGSTLAFNYFVTSSQLITNPSWFGFAQSSYGPTNVSYQGYPSPGWGTGEPPFTLPLGAAATSPIQIIQLPAAGDSSTNLLSLQRYFYKADIVILITNVSPTSVATTVLLKNSMFDSSPLVFSVTNTATNTPAGTNWARAGFNSWLSTNATFYDARQGRTNHVTQIDVGKLGLWLATSSNAMAKWSLPSYFNGIIYVGDFRTTNSMYMNAVRLTNGQTIPSMIASNVLINNSSVTNQCYYFGGLTVATINPLYIAGLYNCPSPNNLSTTNTQGTRPCSVVCDALTILSPNWNDGNSWAAASGTIPTALAADTVNTAVIAGNVPSTGSSVTQFSGGVQNLPRLLENWSASTLWLNTSLVNLYPSAQATAQFQPPGHYYNPPARRFSFDQNFYESFQLPPGTPTCFQVLTATNGTTPTNVTILLGNLQQVYNGNSLVPSVQTVPAGVPLNFQFAPGNCGIYESNAVNAGMYLVVATPMNTNTTGVASNFFYINKAPGSVILSNLAQTFDGTIKYCTITTDPPGMLVDLNVAGWIHYDYQFTNVGVGSYAGSYPITVTLDDYNYTGSASGNLTILPAAATINLTNLAQVYDGNPKAAGAATVPDGLSITYSYNGSPTPPTNAGLYSVTATSADPNYQGSDTETLVVSQAPASLTLSNITQTYDGTAKSVLPITDPTNLSVGVTYNDSTNAPTNAGSYFVSGTVTDPNYQANSTNTFVINQAVATVTLSNLSQTFDGTAKTVSATTVPPGLTIDLTYDDSTNAPTNTGNYVVVGIVDDPNYTGGATNTLAITQPAPAPTPIMLSGLTSPVDGWFQINFTNTPGLSFSVLSSPDFSEPLTNWNFAGSVVEVAPGQYQFIDTQATNNPQQFYIIRSP